jgi:gamma-glutamyltranspeptidase
VDDLDRTVGHAQLVAVDEHGLHAGSDPRADGAAAAG